MIEKIRNHLTLLAENWTHPACPYQLVEDRMELIIDPSCQEVTVSKAENCVTIHHFAGDVNFTDIPFPDELLEAMISS